MLSVKIAVYYVRADPDSAQNEWVLHTPTVCGRKKGGKISLQNGKEVPGGK